MPDNIPRIQRANPGPYVRPSINLGGAADGLTRTWRTVSVARLQIGDVVAGRGLVVSVTSMFDGDADVPWTVTIDGIDGSPYTYAGTETVFAFTSAA